MYQEKGFPCACNFFLSPPLTHFFLSSSSHSFLSFFPFSYSSVFLISNHHLLLSRSAPDFLSQKIARRRRRRREKKKKKEGKKKRESGVDLDLTAHSTLNFSSFGLLKNCAEDERHETRSSCSFFFEDNEMPLSFFLSLSSCFSLFLSSME